jgi:hypothetical protein
MRSKEKESEFGLAPGKPEFEQDGFKLDFWYFFECIIISSD